MLQSTSPVVLALCSKTQTKKLDIGSKVSTQNDGNFALESELSSGGEHVLECKFRCAHVI